MLPPVQGFYISVEIVPEFFQAESLNSAFTVF